MDTSRRTGFFLIILSNAGYAFLPIITRNLYSITDIAPTDIAIWRFIFAAPAIWLGLWLRDTYFPNRKGRRVQFIPRIKMMLIGIFYAGAALAAFFGLQYIPASIYIVLFYTYPAMVALISLAMGKPLPTAAWVALAMTLVGVLLTVPDLNLAEGSGVLLGLLIALANALIVAVLFSVVGIVLQGATDAGRSSAWMITGALIALLFLIPFVGLQVPQAVGTWLGLLTLAVVSTALPILVLNMGIQLIGAAQASIVSTLEPVMTILLALLLLGEVVLPVQWLGTIFILGGVLMLELRASRKKASQKHAARMGPQ